jgi:hypothetical protein
MHSEGNLAFSSELTGTTVSVAGVPGSHAQLDVGGTLVLSDGGTIFWQSNPLGPGDLVLEQDGHIRIGSIILI